MEHKILIVDDEKSVVQQVKSLLDLFGYSSFYIPRAQFLLKRLENENFDLILMDINMPGINGIEALQIVKSNSEYSHIPVIMMTGDTSDETLESCFNYGATDYITKPISELVLKARVKSAIDKQQYIKEIYSKNKELQKSEREIKLAHENITSSINYAKTIQAAVMPFRSTLSVSFPNNFIFFKPRDVVSGDFYWMRSVEHYTFIAVADCTGHGVPGAFLSMLGISLLNEIIHGIEKGNWLNTGEFLGELREKVKEALGQTGMTGEQQDGMDIALCVIDHNDNSMQYSGAHSPVYIVRSKSNESYLEYKEKVNGETDNAVLIEIKGDRQPIGIFLKERPFTTHKMKLQEGDQLYLFSDGFSDQTAGHSHEKFKRKRFRQLFLNLNNIPMNQQKLVFEKTLQRWKGDVKKQIDDILILGIRVE